MNFDIIIPPFLVLNLAGAGLCLTAYAAFYHRDHKNTKFLLILAMLFLLAFSLVLFSALRELFIQGNLPLMESVFDVSFRYLTTYLITGISIVTFSAIAGASMIIYGFWSDDNKEENKLKAKKQVDNVTDKLAKTAKSMKKWDNP